ncbi:MAG: hypothetical protein RBT37_01395 [Dissulfurispiraceae bacterium]|jgi:hypothetical protein|nr:hypothetical protein [Dissulfurispiraceae bacterium]
MTPEEKLLKEIYKCKQKWLLHQRCCTCPECGLKADPYDQSIKVDFRDAVICGREITLLDVYCPGCGRLLQAEYDVVQ